MMMLYGTFGNLLAHVTFSAHFQAIELDWQVEKWWSNEIRFDAIFQLPPMQLLMIQ